MNFNFEILIQEVLGRQIRLVYFMLDLISLAYCSTDRLDLTDWLNEINLDYTTLVRVY